MKLRRVILLVTALALVVAMTAAGSASAQEEVDHCPALPGIQGPTEFCTAPNGNGDVEPAGGTGECISERIGPKYTRTLISGRGPIGNLDPSNKFSTDGGNTWNQARIVSPDPGWAEPIPSTKWISVKQNKQGPAETRYRTSFKLPKWECHNVKLEILLHADNGARFFLNGKELAQQPAGDDPNNFRDPADPITIHQIGAPNLFKKGNNTMEFVVRNSGYATGLDYRAKLTYSQLRWAS